MMCLPFPSAQCNILFVPGKSCGRSASDGVWVLCRRLLGVATASTSIPKITSSNQSHRRRTALLWDGQHGLSHGQPGRLHAQCLSKPGIGCHSAPRLSRLSLPEAWTVLSHGDSNSETVQAADRL